MDLDRALRYLAETGDAASAAVEGLSEETCRCKLHPDEWSIGDCLEHLAIIEDRFLHNAAINLPDAPPPADDFDAEAMDRHILAVGLDRSAKIKAPDRVCPTGAVTIAECLARLKADRARTIDFFRSVDGLRDHAIPHPFFGPLDGYHWALLIAAHTERHVNQILEVKKGLS